MRRFEPDSPDPSVIRFQQIQRRLREHAEAPADEKFMTAYAQQTMLLGDLQFAMDQLAAARAFIQEYVEPLRSMAYDISIKHEPCGYYCDPEGAGHVDHALANRAKYLYGGGTADTVHCPSLLDPRNVEAVEATNDQHST